MSVAASLCTRPVPAVARLLLGLAMLGLAACTSGGEGTVEAGRFEATVSGALVDTLVGTARYRTEDERLVGLELSADTSRGLSMQMKPYTSSARVFDVVEWQVLGTRTDGRPGVTAFLTMPQGEFEARRGTLEVETRSSGRIRGRFEMTMEGTFNGVPVESPSVTVRGRWHAVPEQDGEGPGS